jgi:zinc transport system substrate-binding protein
VKAYGSMQRQNFFLHLLFSLILTALAAQATYLSAAVSVVSSILPETFLIEEIGGERVAVTTLLQGNQSPVSAQASGKLLSKVAQAKIFFRIGVPFEAAWLTRLIGMSEKIEIVDLKKAKFKNLGEDPHYWNDPLNAIEILSIIKLKLTKVDPEGEDYYSKRYHSLVSKLRDLDNKIKKNLSAVVGESFLVFHPAWFYFARRYGLKELAIEKHGKEPAAHDLQSTIEIARKRSVRVIFVQKQFDTKAANVIAKELGIKILEVDPLAKDYIRNLEQFSIMLQKNLKNSSVL